MKMFILMERTFFCHKWNKPIKKYLLNQMWVCSQNLLRVRELLRNNKNPPFKKDKPENRK